MKRISEIWVKGKLVESEEKDDAQDEEVNLRDGIAQALEDLDKIQVAPLGTDAARIDAIQKEAQILGNIIRFLVEKYGLKP